MAEIVFGGGMTLSVPGEPMDVVNRLTGGTSGWATIPAGEESIMVNAAQVAYVRADAMASEEETRRSREVTPVQARFRP